MDELFAEEDLCRSGSTSKNIVEKIEEEFHRMSILSDEQRDRNNEKNTIKKKIKALEVEISRCKNVKNHRKTDANTQIATKRQHLREEIQGLRNRLGDIEDEEYAARASVSKFIP